MGGQCTRLVCFKKLPIQFPPPPTRKCNLISPGVVPAGVFVETVGLGLGPGPGNTERHTDTLQQLLEFATTSLELTINGSIVWVYVRNAVALQHYSKVSLTDHLHGDVNTLLPAGGGEREL